MALLRRLGVAVLVVAFTGAVGATASWALFDRGSSNPGNTVSAATVSISDNDSGGAMFELPAMKPSDPPQERCIRVRYDGDVGAIVRLYGSSTGPLASHLSLTVERGTDPTPSFSSCADFSPDSTDYIGQGNGVVYRGTLSSYPGSFSTGVLDPPGGAQTWTEGEVHFYRITAELVNDPAAQGLSSQASFTWEARDS